MYVCMYDKKVVALRQKKRENALLPVDVRRSKTSLLKLPIKFVPCTFLSHISSWVVKER